MPHLEEWLTGLSQGNATPGLGKGLGLLRRRRRVVLRGHFLPNPVKPAIKRVARKGGVKRISGLNYEETRGVLKVFLENVMKDIVQYFESSKRKTVTVTDVEYALKCQGRPMYQ
ncbi:hypothetical protein FSP39_014710 [Pinctada imbricata]|uniref:Histone H4 n=1 Tax=Pinctada imbricata TaxID=66713 RepID=A0AA88Y8Z1_PINIB|nr:hypothetical protein FSP39_014710 [Pinctada imbricata]